MRVLLIALLVLSTNSCTPQIMQGCKVMCHPYGVRKYDAISETCECNKVVTRRFIEE